MRTLGFRSLLVAFAPLGAPPSPEPPPDVFTTETINAAVAELRDMHVPPFECAKCGERVYVLVPPGETLPRRWQCDCGRVNEIQSSERAAGCLLGSASSGA